MKEEEESFNFWSEQVQKHISLLPTELAGKLAGNRFRRRCTVAEGGGGGSFVGSYADVARIPASSPISPKAAGVRLKSLPTAAIVAADGGRSWNCLVGFSPVFM